MKRDCIFFLFGALLYPLLEIVWRGWSHWSMSFAGGLCLLGLSRVEKKKPHLCLRKKCLLGAVIITLVELTTGLICNKWLQLKVWDYSHLPANLWGQVCLFFTAIWFMLCIPVFQILQRLRLRGK